jgi:hypothetical protein
MTSKYHQPISGASNAPQLAPAALRAFRALWIPGAVFLALALISALTGLSADEYGVMSAYGTMGASFQIAAVLLVGAAVISGLGKRTETATLPE